MPFDQISPALKAADRRSLLRTAGLGAAAVAVGAASLVPREAGAATSSPDLDVAILNFALNLEYLEAEFYLHATRGYGLARPSEIGTHAGAVYGGSKVPFVNTHIEEIANDIAQDEHAHVLFLRGALEAAGLTPADRPDIDLKQSFSDLGVAIGLAPGFSPFADELSFLLGAYIFEDVGVTAYHGAAPLVTDKGYLSAAAGILGVEAYHAGVIRLAILRSTNQTIAVANSISKLRAKLSQADDDSGPTLMRGAYNLVPTDSNSITFARSTRQVLNIVYGSVGASKGLFFPKGLNGPIHS